MIIYFTYFVSVAVILTKWFDCISTLKKIQGIQMESNPIARALMYRLGIRGTVWFAFAVAVIVTVLSQLYVQLWTEHQAWDWAYVFTGLFTAVIQGATALNNYQGKPNFITLLIFKTIRKL